MNPRLARRLVRLYPRAWRERYGQEFEALLEEGESGFRAAANVIGSALHEHIFPTRGRTMNQDLLSFGAIVRRPTAYLPMAMSLTALALVTGALVSGFIAHHSFVVVREPDEGPVAHLWQLLMAGQLPVLLFFAIKWLPRAPRQALVVMALQAAAALASMAPVFFLNL
jgi:hypothetical protein